MTKKSKSGTLSTIAPADNIVRAAKEKDVAGKLRSLLGLNMIRFHPHANMRMAERNVIDYEVRQALHNGKHDPTKDRYSKEWNSWEYSIEGKTTDQRKLRIGIAFEMTKRGEMLLVITVIDPTK